MWSHAAEAVTLLLSEHLLVRFRRNRVTNQLHLPSRCPVLL